MIDRPISPFTATTAALEGVLARVHTLDGPAAYLPEEDEDALAWARAVARTTARDLADRLPNRDGDGVRPFMARHHALTAAVLDDLFLHGCWEDGLERFGWPSTRQVLRRSIRQATVNALVGQITASAAD